MHRFLERVEGEELEGDLDGGARFAGRSLMAEQLRQTSHGELAQPLALGDQPLFERRVAQREASEKIAPVESLRLRRRFGGAACDVLLEHLYVDGDRRRMERHVVPFEHESLRVTERLPEREERGAPAATRLGLGDSPPSRVRAR